MNISKAFSVFALFSFFMASSYESYPNLPMDFKGLVTPLIHITSPERHHYDPNSTSDDRIREKIRLSEYRERYLGLRSLNKGRIDNSSPINSDFLVAFQMGSPPVKSYATLDTGSDIIWQKCKPCKGCSGEAPIYDPSKSKSFELLPCDSPFCSKKYEFSCGPKKSACHYSISYLDSSTSRGVVGTDSFRLVGIPLHPGDLIPNAIFGCASTVKSDDDTDGIIGLGNTSLSLPNQLYRHSSFSYCKGSGTGGFFIVGSDAALVGYKTPLFSDKNGNYQIIVNGISVGGNKLKLPDLTFKYNRKKPFSGVIIDSGTPYTWLHPVAYNGVTTKLKQILRGRTTHKFNKEFQWCYNETADISIQKMPSIHFHLGNNIKLKLPNENIWIKFDKHICLQLIFSKERWTIFGADQLNSYNVGYDLSANLLWLSYYPKNCPY